jgi:hypothetical protein
VLRPRRLRVLQRFDEHRHRIPTQVGKRFHGRHHDRWIGIGELVVEQVGQTARRGLECRDRLEARATGPGIGMDECLGEGVDRVGVGLGVIGCERGFPFVGSDVRDRGGGLGHDERVGILEERDEFGKDGEGILADVTDRAGGMPAEADVVIAHRLDEVVEGRKGVLPEVGHGIDGEHPAILIGGCGQGLAEIAEFVGARRGAVVACRGRGLFRGLRIAELDLRRLLSGAFRVRRLRPAATERRQHADDPRDHDRSLEPHLDSLQEGASGNARANARHDSSLDSHSMSSPRNRRRRTDPPRPIFRVEAARPS